MTPPRAWRRSSTSASRPGPGPSEARGVNELRGKVAVVTGAASGIGYALCERFAAEGMHVVMADVAPDRLEAATGQVEGGDGAEVLGVPTDVKRWDDVENLAARAYERFGGVHLLSNNAGVQRAG